MAIKQFRYSLRRMPNSGVKALSEIKSLRTAQNALGEAHDRDVLVKRIGELGDDGDSVPTHDGPLLEQFLTGYIIDQHQYIAVRRG